MKALKTFIIVSATGVWLAVLAGAGCWYLRGGRLSAVQTGSMAPLISKGDAVVSVTVPLSKLRIGDIISYRDPSNERLIITHRLIALDAKAGWLTTQGDALENPDRSIPKRLLQGRVTAVAPGVGKLIDEVHTPLALLLFIYLPAAVIILAEIQRLAHLPQTLYRFAGYHG